MGWQVTLQNRNFASHMDSRQQEGGEFSRFALDRHVDQAYDGRGRSILRLDA